MAEESSFYEIAGKTSLTSLLNDWQEPVAEALNEAAKAVSELRAGMTVHCLWFMIL